MDNIQTPPQLKTIEQLTKLLDSKFKIPGTNIKFGYDFLIGLLPFGGDVITFIFSGALVLAMARHGVSGYIVGKMLLNIALDTVIGSIPILGDAFDIYFKANRRNYQLLEEHYGEGKHTGSIWKVLLPVFLVLVALFVLLFWILVKLVIILWQWVSSLA